MNYVGKFFSNFKGFYNDINSATLTGAIDILVVRQEDGTYATSPWHVRFGKMGVIRAREKLASTSLSCQTLPFVCIITNSLEFEIGTDHEQLFVTIVLPSLSALIG